MRHLRVPVIMLLVSPVLLLGCREQPTNMIKQSNMIKQPIMIKQPESPSIQTTARAGEERFPSILEEKYENTMLAPTLVQVGREFKIKFYTFGSGCERQGGVEVTVSGLEAVVKPYDFTVARAGVMCTKEAKSFRHTAVLRFDELGEATIRVESSPWQSKTHRLKVTTDPVPYEFEPDMPVDRWRVTENQMGPFRIGENPDLAWEPGFEVSVRSLAPCEYRVPKLGPKGVVLTVTGAGHVRRIDVNSRSVATAAGARVGDSEERIQALYPQVTRTPHLFLKGGHYLRVNPFGNRHIIFETDGKRVLRYRAGREPEIYGVNGCP